MVNKLSYFLYMLAPIGMAYFLWAYFQGTLNFNEWNESWSDLYVTLCLVWVPTYIISRMLKAEDARKAKKANDLIMHINKKSKTLDQNNKVN